MKATIQTETKIRDDKKAVFTIRVVRGADIVDSQSFFVRPGYRKEAADYIRRNRFLYN